MDCALDNLVAPMIKDTFGVGRWREESLRYRELSWEEGFYIWINYKP